MAVGFREFDEEKERERLRKMSDEELIREGRAARYMCAPSTINLVNHVSTASDISCLAASLERWELAEYFSCGLVALACSAEYIAEFTDRWTGGIKEKKDDFENGHSPTHFISAFKAQQSHTLEWFLHRLRDPVHARYLRRALQ